MNLVELRGRVRAALADTNGLAWSDEMLDESLREALDMLSMSLPRTVSVELVALEGLEVELAGVLGLIDVLEVWRMDGVPREVGLVPEVRQGAGAVPASAFAEERTLFCDLFTSERTIDTLAGFNASGRSITEPPSRGE
mgnify:CR=1 FL=1